MFVDPLDQPWIRADVRVNPFRPNELHGIGAVLSNMRYEGGGAPRGHLKSPRPPVQNEFVVWQKTPVDGLDRGMLLDVARQGDRQRYRISIRRITPVVLIADLETFPSISNK